MIACEVLSIPEVQDVEEARDQSSSQITAFPEGNSQEICPEIAFVRADSNCKPVLARIP
jgi:hypothetical protein